MKKIILGLVTTTSLLFSSATLFNGSTQTVDFTSEPTEATVKINGFPICKTPCKAELKRSSSVANITVEKEGYKETYFQAPTYWNGGWLILDIVWDLGTTDALTGSWYHYDKDKYFVELKKEDN